MQQPTTSLRLKTKAAKKTQLPLTCLEAASPQDVTASASLDIVGRAVLRSLTDGCFTRTYNSDTAACNNAATMTVNDYIRTIYPE